MSFSRLSEADCLGESRIGLISPTDSTGLVGKLQRKLGNVQEDSEPALRLDVEMRWNLIDKTGVVAR